MIIDCLADLRGTHPELTHGDLLIIAGNGPGGDTGADYSRFYEWCLQQKYRKVIFIGGNEDSYLCKHAKPFNKGKVEYLCDSGTVFEDYKIWGSPWSCGDFDVSDKLILEIKPFTTSHDVAEMVWDKIPHDVDILITYTPCEYILDTDEKGNHVGSDGLMRRMTYCFRPFVHVFGQVLASYGQIEKLSCKNDKLMKSVNASMTDSQGKLINKPIRVTL